MTRGLLAALALVCSLLTVSALSAPIAYADACDAASISSASLEKRGCCSHHNGVCGCNSSTGMQRCCDGTDSPSCRCGE